MCSSNQLLVLLRSPYYHPNYCFYNKIKIEKHLSIILLLYYLCLDTHLVPLIKY
jgi:hypothetical protein